MAEKKQKQSFWDKLLCRPAKTGTVKKVEVKEEHEDPVHKEFREAIEEYKCQTMREIMEMMKPKDSGA